MILSIPKQYRLFIGQYRSYSVLRKCAHKFECPRSRLQRHAVSVVRSSFWESNPRGWEYPPPPTEYSISEHIIRGSSLLVDECKLWVEEVREKFLQDRKKFNHGDTDVIFRFNSEECLKKWSVGSDSTLNEGHSKCHFIVNNNGKGLFYGNVDTATPKDGRAKRAGYCTIRSRKLLKSFQRPAIYEWDVFTHLELRVKGDGRTYGILLGLGHVFDVLWLDVYQYLLYTRGGPYWETIRIPFSKFYRTSKGRIQDDQEAVPKSIINSVGISCFGIPGPFRLEIDYIGVHVDYGENEKFAYEMYYYPKYLVSN